MADFDAERHQRWRSQVVLGPLSADFLRIESSAPPPQPSTQLQTVSAPPPQHYVAAPPTLPGYSPYGNAGHGNTHQILGVLDITISQARLTKNYGITRMDPFCRVRIGHSVLETPTASNAGKTPRWNKLLRSNIPAGVMSAYLEIFDERAFGMEEKVAACQIDFPERLLSGSSIVDEWYPLNGKQGEGKEGVVNVIMSFQKATQQVMQPQPMMVDQYGQPVMMVPNQPVIHRQPAQPRHQPPRPQPISQTDVQSLADMFPAIPRDTVHTILENCGGSMERAVDQLVAMS